jgi:D-alanine-D-alanine ligase
VQQVKQVAVLMGGRSAERQVSLSTGRQVLDALDRSRYIAWELDVDDLPQLAVADVSERPDVVFIALHGPGGEDGTVQGFLETLGIPYTGSGVLASALAMDKVRTKALLSTENVILPADLVFYRRDEPRLRRAAREVSDKFIFPVIVKPNRQGSTYGCTVAHSADEVSRALELGFDYDDTVLVEQRVEGAEITVAVLGNDDLLALPVVEIVSPGGFFDYEAKYSSEAHAEVIVPARISRSEANEAREIALLCHRLLGCRGMSRTDMFVTDEGVVTLEVNTIPGMTPTSLLPQAAQAAGIPFADLVDRLIGYALERGEA